MTAKSGDLADQIRILATGLAVQARDAGLDTVAEHLEAAARAAQTARPPDGTSARPGSRRQ
jgi:hypothetical protein